MDNERLMEIEELVDTRQYQINARNQANLTRYHCARAWLDHNNEQPRDFRTPEQRERWSRRRVVNHVRPYDNSDGEDYFEYRWCTLKRQGNVTMVIRQYATVDGRSWMDLESRPVKRVGEIEAEYTAACMGCGQVIDPIWCWCGDRLNSYHEHTPVPMGCDCYRVAGEHCDNIERRIAHGLTAGIGDAPGTARVIPEPRFPNRPVFPTKPAVFDDAEYLRNGGDR